MSDVHRTEGEPHDKLTRIAAAMAETMDAHPEAEGVKGAVYLQDGEMGGIVLNGYDDEKEAAADLFQHLRAMFRAAGSDLTMAPMPAPTDPGQN